MVRFIMAWRYFSDRESEASPDGDGIWRRLLRRGARREIGVRGAILDAGGMGRTIQEREAVP
jgi:hypothetical protein